MEAVDHPYPGYRIKKQFSHLISEHPANSGRLYKDPNGRPSGMVLSALYLGCGPKYYQACQACDREERYPGRIVTTSFGSDYNPRDEYDRMMEELRQ